VPFLELRVREFGGKTMSFSCARLRVTKSVRRRSTVADHRVSGLREGRIMKYDTPLMRSRVARGASTWALANGYIWRALTRKGSLPVSSSREAGVKEKEPRVSDSRIAKSKALLKAGPQYRGAVSTIHLKGTPGA